MKKSYCVSLILLVFILITPLLINGVNASWTYYEGEVDPVSVDITEIKLARFNYLQNEFDKEFPETPSGVENENAFDKIMGEVIKTEDIIEDSKHPGLNNQNSDLNMIYLSAQYLPESGFITSIDIKSSQSKLQKIPYEDGAVVKEKMGVGEDVSFAIQKVERRINGDQVWAIYTTNTKITNDLNGKVIEDVYRTELLWDANGVFSKKGTYIIVKSERGYSYGKINPNNNPNDVFFDPDNWHPGIYGGFNVTSDKNDTKYLNLGETINLSASIGNNNVTWKSSNPILISVDEKGVATVASDTIDASNKAIELTATDKNDENNYAGIVFFVNLPEPNNNYSGLSISGLSVNKKAKGVSLPSSGYLYPNSSMNQTISFNGSNSASSDVKIKIESESKNVQVVVQYVTGSWKEEIKNIDVVTRNKSFTFNQSQGDITYYVTFKADKPLKYDISLVSKN